LGRSYFHLHLVSDATGETLIAASRAAAAQYQGVASIEHVYPLVRTHSQLDRVIAEIENAPGIVLFTLVDGELSRRLEASCDASGSPCLSVLSPILTLFQSYLGTASTPRAGAQHMLNAEYFRRIDALNFTMMHDDGQLTENLGKPTLFFSASAAPPKRRRASISPIAASRPPMCRSSPMSPCRAPSTDCAILCRSA
jgi:regulator of PEP synthase PpsR (kinase-PPPase family)